MMSWPRHLYILLSVAHVRRQDRPLAESKARRDEARRASPLYVLLAPP